MLQKLEIVLSKGKHSRIHIFLLKEHNLDVKSSTILRIESLFRYQFKRSSFVLQVLPGMEVLGDSNNTSGKSMSLQEQQHPAMLHHYHNHAATPNVRRYSAVPSIEPSQIHMYSAPSQMYATPNAPCYACLTVPVAGLQNRYSRYA